MRPKWIADAADEVLEELKCRRGIGHMLHELENDDEEIYDEIRESLIAAIQKHAP